MGSCVCAIDLGSTAVKAALVDRHGTVLALTSLAAPRVEGPEGAFDSEAYLRTVFRALRRLLGTAADPALHVEGLSLSSQRATAVLLDDDAKPVGPALSWQGTACAAAAREFYGRLGEGRFLDLTGLPPAPIYTVAKLAHLAAADPARLARSASVLTLHDWVLFRLGADRPLADRSGASATGLYDLRRGTWSTEIADRLGLDAGRLPGIAAAGSAAGVSSAEVERAAGLPRGTPLFVGGGDQQCASLGAGAVPGDCVLSLGTAAAVMAPLEALPGRTPPGFLLLAHVVTGGFQVEGFMSAFGSCAAWAARALRARGARALEELAATASAGSGGAIFLPFLAGAGSPDQNPAARGAFVGLDLSTSRADLARSVFLGLACEVRRIVDALREAMPIVRLAVVGGAGGRGLLPGLLAGVAGLPLVALGQREAAVLGAAALAWSGLGGGAPDAVALGFTAGEAETLAPAGDRHALEAAYSRYLEVAGAPGTRRTGGGA